jgi:hypothetical protein
MHREEVEFISEAPEEKEIKRFLTEIALTPF